MSLNPSSDVDYVFLHFGHSKFNCSLGLTELFFLQWLFYGLAYAFLKVKEPFWMTLQVFHLALPLLVWLTSQKYSCSSLWSGGAGSIAAF